MAKSNPKQERLARVALFSDLTRDQLGLLDRLADEVTVPAGKSIVSQGRLGNDFFVIESGEISVVRDGTEVARLHAGDHFGELAVLAAPLRNADVVAVTDADLVVIGAREFMTLLEDVPGIALTLLRTLARRVQGS